MMDHNVVDLAARARSSWFVPTKIAASIAHVFDCCASQRGMGLIVGVPGAGKTVAARAYAEDNVDARLITMGERHDGILAALGQILETLAGDLPPARAAADMHRLLAKVLRFGPNAFRFTGAHNEEHGESGTSLLIVDEAHYLDQRSANAIRDLADDVSVGVVFVGNLNLYDRWFSEKAGSRVASEQFCSRIGPRLIVDEVPPNDVRAILAARGVSGESELDFLACISRSDGPPPGSRAAGQDRRWQGSRGAGRA